tara:strand:+ start:15814 stop:18450 length:2637 start_codon:yes stop_codon:yes gene_type:complete
MAEEQLILQLRARGVTLTKNQLKKLDASAKKAGTSMKGLIGAVGGIYALGKAFSFVGKVGMEFTSAQSNLAAILGTTSDKLGALDKTAKELGRTTKFTAGEVVSLQTEYAKLGFSTKQIQNAQKATLSLASAVNVDLSTAAEVSGQMVNAFGLGAKQTQRAVDVMAKSFSSSALDMDKFTNSMTYVSAIAAQSGVSIEATTGILGKLADVGIDGSIAGTALRRVMLEMGNEASKLSKKVGFAVKSDEDLFRALQILNEEGMSTAEMTDLVGKRAVSAFANMLKMSEGAQSLTNELRKAGGTADEMADEQLKNLEGDMLKLKSATEGLALDIFESLEPALRQATQALTSLIGFFDIGRIKSYSSALGVLALAWGAVALKTKAAGFQLTKFKAKMVKSGIGVLILGLGELINYMGWFDDEVDDSNEATEEWSRTLTTHLSPAMKDLAQDLANIDTVVGLQASIDAFTVATEDQKKKIDEKHDAIYKEAQLLKEKGEIEKIGDYMSQKHLEIIAPMTAEYLQLLDKRNQAEEKMVLLLDSRDRVNNQLSKSDKVLAGVGSSEYETMLKDLKDFNTIKKDLGYTEKLELLQQERDYWTEVVELYGLGSEEQAKVDEAFTAKSKQLKDENLDAIQAYFDAEMEITHEQNLLKIQEEIDFQRALIETTMEAGEEKEKALSDLAAIEKKKKEKANKEDKKLNAQRVANTVEMYGRLAGGIAGYFAVTGKNAELMTNLQYIEAIANTYKAASEAYTRHGGWPGGVLPAAISVTQGLAQVAQIKKARDEAKAAASKSVTAEYGANFVTDGLTNLTVGDNPGGQELVNVTPLSSPNMFGDPDAVGGGGGQTINVQIEGGLISSEFVENELAEKIADGVRRGVDFGINQ